MQINCPNCGNACEIDGELAIGQHLICPFCSEKFAYPGTERGSESLHRDVSAEYSNIGEITAKCPHCGTLYEVEYGCLGQEATCETCGKNFVIADVKPFASDFGTDMTAQESVGDSTDGKETATVLAKAKTLATTAKDKTVTWWKNGKEGREAFVSQAKAAAKTAKSKTVTLWKSGTKGKIVLCIVTMLALCTMLLLCGRMGRNRRIELDSASVIGDKTWQYSLIGNNATITGVSPAIGDVKIPAEVGAGNYTVTSIGRSAFKDCCGLTSATIPSTVLIIGNDAFHGCTNMTRITIGESVTNIGKLAFAYCCALRNVKIPSSVVSIEEGIFMHDVGLMSITVEKGNATYKSVNGLLLTKDGKTLIQGVSGSVTIPNSVTRIGDAAFFNFNSLERVTIPNSVTSVGSGAFFSCDSLKQVIIPSSITNIAAGAFFGCSGLTNVTIPDSVTSIGDKAFGACTGLTSASIPETLADSKSSVFWSCNSLSNGKGIIVRSNVSASYEETGDGKKASASRSESNSRALKFLDELEAKEIYAKGYVSYELKGRFTNKYDEAFKLFTEASQLGFLPADAMLSYMYFFGEGCETDYAKAFGCAKKVVSSKDLDVLNRDYRDASNLARFTLGTLYLVGFTDANGKRQKDDYKAYGYYCEMVRSMDKAERQGKTSKSSRTLLDRTSFLATFAIAIMYHDGRGTSKSIDAAAKLFELFTMLHDEGDDIDKMRGEAEMCLGLLYYRGDGVGRNRALAWKHLRNGAVLAFPELIRAAKAPLTNEDVASFNRIFGHVEISQWTPYSWKMYNLYKGKSRPHVFSLLESDLLEKALMTLFNPDCWLMSGVDYNFDDM